MPDLNGKAPEKGYLEKTMGLKEETILSYCEAGCYPEYFIYRSVRHPYGKILQCRG